MSIQKLVGLSYDIFNVNKKKQPIDIDGYGMVGWEKMPYNELVKNHNYNLNRWGIRLGKQTNGNHILSLDFDVCGKPNIDGIRLGCPDTQRLLEEYRANIDRDDGMFSSSTEGNMNVLVDYTISSKIQEWVAKLGKAKFSKHELEILVAQNQIIPPSATTSKITHSLGPARAFICEQEFYVMDSEEGFMFDFLKRLFSEELQKCGAKNTISRPIKQKNTQIVETRNSEVSTEQDTEMTDIYEILLFNYIKNDFDEKGKKRVSWDNWFKICGILKYNNYDYSVWERYNALIPIQQPTDNLREIWNRRQYTPMSIYGLYNICKDVGNEQGLKEWKIKYKKYLSLKMLQKGENDVAKYIAPFLNDKLVFCNDRWNIYDKRTGLWRAVKEPTSTIVSEIHNQIDEARESLLYVKIRTENTEEKEKIDKNEKLYMTFYANIAKGGYSSTIKKYLTELLYDAEFQEKLDNNKYKVAYKNGIRDLKTGEFREGLLPNDYLTKTIKFNYEKPTDGEKDLVRKELQKICNNNPLHLDYYLSTFGYAMTGDSSKIQKFWCLRGQKASNGKSVIFEGLTVIAPNYVVQMESDMFESNYGSRHKEISSWGGIRILWVNELSKKKQDAEFVKKLCDGTSQPYKVMYGCMAIMPISFKFFCVSNHTLSVDGDNGFNRRLVMEQFDSDFIDDLDEEDPINCKFKKDTSFGEKLQTTYKHALLELIYDYSKSFVDDGYVLKPYPKEWKEETKDTVESNSDFPGWFEENFEKGQDLQTSKRSVEDRLSAYKFDHKNVDLKFKDELKRMSVKFKYDSQERYAGEKSKGVYTGFTLKILEKNPSTDNQHSTTYSYPQPVVFKNTIKFPVEEDSFSND